MIAIFGNKVFTVSTNKLYTFDGLSIEGELNTEDQEVDGGKPGTHVKGSGLEKMKFSLFLDAQLGIDVRQEIDDWRAILDAATAQVFIIGERPLSQNKWLLKSVGGSVLAINNRGKFLKASIELSFSEYVEQRGAAAGASTGVGNKKSSKRNNYHVAYCVAKGPGGGRMLVDY